MKTGKCISCGEEKELNDNNTCSDCHEEVEEIIDELVENNNNSNPGTDEIVDSGSDDNFEATVKERNEQAEEAKEILNPGIEEDEEKDSKKGSIVKTGLIVVGTGLVLYGAFNVYSGYKTAQTPQIANS